MIKRIGKRTLALENRPYLLGHAAAVGKKEGEGPLGERFDYVAKNDRMGQRSWELAESELQKTAIRLALRKATLPERSLDLILAFLLGGAAVPFSACLRRSAHTDGPVDSHCGRRGSARQ